MADSKISDLTATTTLADADLMTSVQSGANKKITGASLKSEVGWERSGTEVTPKNAADNVNIGTGGLKDNDVATAISLGSVVDTSFNTTKKDIVGAVNEVRGNIPTAVEDDPTDIPVTFDGQTVFTLTSIPSGSAAFALYLNGQLRLRGTDYTQAGTTLTWLDPGGLTLLTTDELIARYNDTALAGIANPTGYINELKLETNSSNPTFQIDINTGSCRNDDNDGDITLTSIKTVDITASGVDGLDTGSEASDTWYFVWIIKHTDGTVSGLLSLSSTSPTLPSGYTKKRRIGSVRNDSSSDFIPFMQRGNATTRGYNYLDTVTNRQLLSGGSAQSATEIDLSTLVPPTTQNTSLFVRQQGTVSLFIYQDVAGAVLEGVLAGGSVSLSNFSTTTSQRIAYSNFGAGGSADIFVRGYGEDV